VAIVVLLLKDNGVGILIPLNSTEIPQLGQFHPPLPPLPQVVVHLCTTHIIATELLEGFGYLVEMHFFEALVSPHSCGN
jgi:hypothetical protein